MTGMSIQEISRKFKDLFLDSELFLAVLILLVAVVSFGLGRMSIVAESLNSDGQTAKVRLTTALTPNQQTTPSSPSAPAEESVDVSANGNYVASKNGARYHLPWCPGAQQMNEENKIWFDTKEEAEIAGYTPAANCKGL
jgi:hypothetical protein